MYGYLLLVVQYILLPDREQRTRQIPQNAACRTSQQYSQKT